MPPATTFALVTDATVVTAACADLVNAEPEAMSVLASVTDGLLADPSRYVGARWWLGSDRAGRTVAAFMHTPPHPLHVALATAAEARRLAASLADAGDQLPGVGGLRGPAEEFANEWVARTGATARVTMQVGRFTLTGRPVVPYEVPGSPRTATDEDTPLLDDWHGAFVEAIESSELSRSSVRHVPSLAGAVAQRRVALWQDGGRPVSMAYASPSNGGVTRISGVWTPPDLRRRGYASGIVAALSMERLQAGERCMLYTDLANPTSNAIYEAIGYRRVGDSISIAFSA